MVAAAAGLLVEKGQLCGVGIDDGQWAQQALGVAVQGQQVLALLPCQQAVQRALGALALVDGLGLFSSLIDAEHQTAVQKLFVDLNRGGGQKNHHRPFDAVFLRHQIAGGRVFSGAGNGQLAFRLQELQGVAGAARTLLLDDGENLVLEIRLAHVEKALPGHRRILDPLLLRHEGQHRIHQAGFARRRGALHQHGERRSQLARDCGEIAGEFVDALADEAASLKVHEDAIQ